MVRSILSKNSRHAQNGSSSPCYSLKHGKCEPPVPLSWPPLFPPHHLPAPKHIRALLFLCWEYFSHSPTLPSLEGRSLTTLSSLCPLSWALLSFIAYLPLTYYFSLPLVAVLVSTATPGTEQALVQWTNSVFPLLSARDLHLGGAHKVCLLGFTFIMSTLISFLAEMKVSLLHMDKDWRISQKNRNNS